MHKLLISIFLTTAALGAAPITLDLDPLGGSIAGAPGSTVGWGFTLTNASTSWISVTSSALTFETNPSLGVYVDFIGLQSGPPPSFAVAPSGFWAETFDSVSQGIGSYPISNSAALFAEDSGSILVSFDIFDGDPSNGGIQTGSSSVSAPFSVDVAPSSQVPEPSTLALTAVMLGLLLAAAVGREYVLSPPINGQHPKTTLPHRALSSRQGFAHKS